MKVLVSGATGFIASHLVPRLVREGHSVVALGHDPARLPSGHGVRQLVVDLSRSLPADDFPAVDAIVHLAQANTIGPSRSQDLMAVNVASTCGLLDVAVRHKAEHFVLASSGSVYGATSVEIDERTPVHPLDEYGESKVLAEQLLDEFRDRLHVTALRLFVPYGPGQSGRMIPALAERIRSGTPIVLNENGRPHVNPVYVKDVVDAILSTLSRPDVQLVNVAGPDVVDVRELSERIAGELNCHPRFVAGDNTNIGDIVASTTRVRDLIRRELTPLADGLHRTFGTP